MLVLSPQLSSRTAVVKTVLANHDAVGRVSIDNHIWHRTSGRWINGTLAAGLGKILADAEFSLSRWRRCVDAIPPGFLLIDEGWSSRQRRTPHRGRAGRVRRNGDGVRAAIQASVAAITGAIENGDSGRRRTLQNRVDTLDIGQRRLVLTIGQPLLMIVTPPSIMALNSVLETGARSTKWGIVNDNLGSRSDGED